NPTKARKALSIALLFGLVLAVVGCVEVAYGQGLPASLTGIVFDQSKAVIANADVVLKHDATGAVRRTVSNADGYFSIVGIQAGPYSVSIEAQGFVKYERQGLILHAWGQISVPVLGYTVSASQRQ